MKKLRSFVTWVKEHAVELGVVVGSIISGILLWGSYNRPHKNVKESIKTKVALEKTKLTEKKVNERMSKLDKLSLEKVNLDREIREQKARVLAASKNVKETRDEVDRLSDEDIADKFNDLYRKFH